MIYGFLQKIRNDDYLVDAVCAQISLSIGGETWKYLITISLPHSFFYRCNYDNSFP